MTTVGLVCLGLLATAAVLCVWRIVRGPTMLDRTVATDVFVATAVASIAIEAAINRHTTTLPILLALAFVGFLGSVSIARFAAGERKESDDA